MNKNDKEKVIKYQSSKNGQFVVLFPPLVSICKADALLCDDNHVLPITIVHSHPISKSSSKVFTTFLGSLENRSPSIIDPATPIEQRLKADMVPKNRWHPGKVP